MTGRRETVPVDNGLFQAVYDSPASLPGRHRWVTPDEDVRELEGLLGMPANTIHAPLWVSGDTKACTACGRQVSWLDIVSSALNKVHDRAMIARVILGDQKFVNVEAPKAVPDVLCARCKAPVTDLRSFKCHNWAYAFEDLERVLEHMSDTRS
ncbi:hypothetical protein ACIOHR_37585 [Streptomyces anulatus]